MIKRRINYLSSHKPEKARFIYRNKKLENPFFYRKRRKKIKFLNLSLWPWKNKRLLIEIIFLLFLFIWFIFASGFFTIKEVIVDGINPISSQEIESLIWQQTTNNRFLLISQKNIITLSKNKLVKVLKENYYFENLTINKKFPDTLIVRAQEKSYSFIWLEDDKYYYADINGNIITEINPLDIKQMKYPLIYNRGEEKIAKNYTAENLRKIEVDIKYTKYIINLFNEFQNWDAGEEKLKLERFIIDQDIDTVKVEIYEGPLVYFNINEDQVRQLKKLLVIKNENLKNDFKNKIYIDLRYGDRVYYR